MPTIFEGLKLDGQKKNMPTKFQPKQTVPKSAYKIDSTRKQTVTKYAYIKIRRTQNRRSQLYAYKILRTKIVTRRSQKLRTKFEALKFLKTDCHKRCLQNSTHTKKDGHKICLQNS